MGYYWLPCNWELLRERIVSKLRELFPSDPNSQLLTEIIWFQQDGAQPHFGCQMRQ